MLGLDQVRRYAWADEDINLAWTLAVITECTPADVVGAYGGDPHRSPEILPFAKAHVPLDELGTYSLVQVREVGDCVVAVENTGWLGASTDVAGRASAGDGSFISVFWDLNANYKVTQAIDGKLVASFDPLSVHHPAPVGDTYPDWITELVFTDEGLHAELLAVVEQQTSVAFDQTWLTEPLPTYRVPG